MSTADDLTPSQRQAVEHLDGPLLVLAGPGSGKTRVITRRIARMVERGVDPRNILAITFTNKAADEMGRRVAALLSPPAGIATSSAKPEGSRPPLANSSTRSLETAPGGVWVSTFHKFCARLLRRRAAAVGLQPNFSIYDTADQLQVLRQVLHDLDIDAVHYSPSRLAHRISRAKNAMQTADHFVRTFDESIGDHFQAVVARVYPAYQRALLKSNAVDFDDLLLHVVALLEENPEIRSELDERFRYILVDEYQDTNLAQYQIVAALSHDHPNLCVTGDPDQSIYGWRGAEIGNILRFEADFPDAKVVRLEENFRSTKHVLRAADSLIAHNVYRKAKRLVTANAEGEPVELLLFPDGRVEADAMAAEIRRLVDAGERGWSDFAIFYRVNALSREVELALSRHRVPYQVAAGVAFYERAEIKDMLAYLRLIHNPEDETAFRRIVNTPRRGIGKTTLAKLAAWAGRQGMSLLEACAQALPLTKGGAGGVRKSAAPGPSGERRGRVAGAESAKPQSGTPSAWGVADSVPATPAASPGLPKQAAKALREFARLIAELSPMQTGSVEELLRAVIERTEYTAAWQGSDSEDDLQRLANVEELVTAARQYDRNSAGEGSSVVRSLRDRTVGSRSDPTTISSLEGFLETTSLVSDVDAIDETAGRVTLMTLHAAKGLEFPVVYVLAVEQNLIPHERSLNTQDLRELEEERRLLFVGMTRAMQRLYLTYTVEREFRGRPLRNIPSEFLSEMELAAREVAADGVPFDATLRVDRTGERGPSAPRRERSETGSKAGGLTPPARRTPLLMTGADLLNGTPREAEVPQGFAVGMQVRHPKYGLGTVVTMGLGTSSRRTLTVEFDDGGRSETFVASKCPLQPIGVG